MGRPVTGPSTPTDYDPIAAQYQRAKQQPWREHVERHTMAELIGDLAGKSVLDLACGEGFLTRFVRARGAARVIGVDVSAKMIELARQQEAREPLGIEYVVRDARQLGPAGEAHDVVTAGYLLNYARTADELLDMCRAVARNLKPGGRFVTVNNNPSQPVEDFGASRKYGYVKLCGGELREGSPIVHRFFLDDGELEITNYHLSVATYEWALAAAGLREVRWHPPRLSPEGEAEYGLEFWSGFLQSPPITFIECSRHARGADEFPG